MSFFDSVSGSMEVELTSAALENALESISLHGIEMKRLKRVGEISCVFSVRQSSYRHLHAICRKRGDSLRILRETGVFFWAHQLRKRLFLTAGFLFLLALVCVLPTRVLFVRVEGNGNVPEKQILAAAEECGICFGASRRQVRSEKTKNALLSKIEALQWAGVNTSGCVAIISVRERSEPEDPVNQPEVASIVASRDGYILSCTANSGNLLVQPGQSVEKGQVLISGYTDCGLSIQATRAEGEIWALTSREIEVISPTQYLKTGDMGKIKRKYSILIRKKRINLWKDSGIWEGTCGRMYTEYYITLPGGFRLPFAMCVEEYVPYETHIWEASPLTAEEQLYDFAYRSLLQQMVAGKILDAKQAVVPEEGIYRMNGTYACTEMIGKLRQEQIGDTNGKIS